MIDLSLKELRMLEMVLILATLSFQQTGQEKRRIFSKKLLTKFSKFYEKEYRKVKRREKKQEANHG